MGKPAARIGDMTAHGGALVAGFPTVLIGGMPAARLGDMHVCPMMTPAVPPIPHVGGPVALGSTGVLIGGMPAARMGDMLVCVGPPDSIVMGCPTVLIGEVGGSAGGGGGGGGGGTAAAQTSAATAQFDNSETVTKEEHWVEFQFVDKAGNPVSGVQYEFEDSDSNKSSGTLRLDGTIRRDGISEGECKAQLFSVTNAKWSKEKAEVGEKIKLTADVEGFEESTEAVIEIYKRDIKGPDEVIETIEVDVKNKKVEDEWEYEYNDDIEDTQPEIADKKPDKYSLPQYYFDIIIGNTKARSGLLAYKDYIEIELVDKDDKPMKDEEYILYLSDGEVRKGKLDGNGYAREEKIPPCLSHVKFPNLKGTENNE